MHGLTPWSPDLITPHLLTNVPKGIISISEMGTRYIEIPADSLTGAIEAIGAAVASRGGSIVSGRSGRERTYELAPHRGRGVVLVYTSLSCGADTVRQCGTDAVRIVVGHRDADGKFRPHGKGQRIYRTAPKGEPSARVAAFLGRLTGVLREAYGAAMRVPSCPSCEAVMGKRTVKSTGRQFWGCSMYPECKATREVSENAADGRQGS